MLYLSIRKFINTKKTEAIFIHTESYQYKKTEVIFIHSEILPIQKKQKL